LNSIPIFIFLIFIAFFRLDYIIWIIVFFVPISVGLHEFFPELPFNLFIPTEPLLVATTLLFFVKLLQERKFDLGIINHPVSIAIYLNLAWIMITSITSTMPLVSFKFLFSRLWFIIPFYFIASQLFSRLKNYNKFAWLYIIPLLGVIVYTIYNHASISLFDHHAAHSAMKPFYNDHTAYGAILAMFIPFSAGFMVRYAKKDLPLFFLALLVTVVLVIALLLSYSRAAWISLIGAVAVFVVIELRIKFVTLLIIGIAILAILFSQREQILLTLEQNRQDSSGDLSEHVQSISNVTTDASNLERLNRWNAAFKMFAEKPFFGWGPGTYMFQYAPFQMARDKTIISTNAGDMGNAHSEYIGPLAESGVLGTITFLFIVITVIYTGIKVYINTNRRRIKILSMSALMGLITYLTHGILNNFLDTDKASVPFWAFAAMLVALDIYHVKDEKEERL
jgi:O-antigen ligase